MLIAININDSQSSPIKNRLGSRGHKSNMPMNTTDCRTILVFPKILGPNEIFFPILKTEIKALTISKTIMKKKSGRL